jgi:hypothetical protein
MTAWDSLKGRFDPEKGEQIFVTPSQTPDTSHRVYNGLSETKNFVPYLNLCYVEAYL